MNSRMVTVEIECEVFYEEWQDQITPTSVVVQTILPLRYSSTEAMKVLALDKFEAMVKEGKI